MRASGREWVGGCFALRGWSVADPPFEPEVILWLELPDGVIVGSEIVDPREREPSFAQSLRKAMAAPMIGRKRRPTRIRVADAHLADQLRSVVGDLIPITVAATPEIDEAGAELVRMSAAPEPMSSYLAGGRVSAGAVAELFAAAQVLWSVAPWKVVVDGDVLRIDVPELGVDGACLAIIGALGESIGLLLFSSVEAYDAFASAAAELDTHGAPGPFVGKLLSLTFQRGSVLSAELRREIAANKWPIASADAYPLLEWMENDSAPDALSESDVRLATAVAGAVSAFVVRHRDWFEGETEEPACESMTGATELRVRVTVPYEAGELFEFEPAPAPAVRTARVGRNDPCPCGSGKKYKKCHLGIDESRSSPRSDASEFHALDRRLTDTLHEFALRRFGKEWLRELESLRARDAAAEIALKWALFSLPVQGRPIVDWFSQRENGPLRSEERAWLSAERAAWLSVWEVTAVEQGTSLRLVDLLSGELREVREASGSRTLCVRDALLGRVVDHAGLSLLCGVYARPLPPSDAATLVRRLRAKLHARAGELISAERLRDAELARDLIRRWQRSVDALDARHATPPDVHNTDGHELLLTVDHFEISISSRAQVEARLASLPDVTPPSDGDDTYDFLRPGSAGTISGSRTIIGFARIRNDALRLETNSLLRADALRALVESACGPLLRHRAREHSDPQALLALDDRSQATPAAEHTPEQQAALAEIKVRYYIDWLDTPIPALGNRTPRQSIRSRTGREQVDLLLKDLENTEARLPAAERFDVGVLRRELGVEG